MTDQTPGPEIVPQNKPWMPLITTFAICLGVILLVILVFYWNDNVVQALNDQTNSLENVIDENSPANNSVFIAGGELDVNVQDQTTRVQQLFFGQAVTGTPYTLSADTVGDTYDINLTTSAGLTVGDWFGLFQDSSDPASYFATISAINGNTITLDTPVDVVFETSRPALGFELSRDLNVDASVNREIFFVGNQASVPVDITRIIIKIITDSVPDFNKFGDITGGLDKGVVLRVARADGTFENIFNVKTNGEFANLAYDLTTYDASNPGQGVYGVGVRMTFGGQSKHGVVIRLSQDDELQLVIQDDLSSLESFRIVAEGHFTDEIPME